MSTVIGLAIASDELRAVTVRDGAVTWAARTGRTAEPALDAQIAALLQLAPVSRWRRPRVVAAVGPGAAQLKCLTGLPPLTDRAALGAIVREGAARFFLRNGIPLEITGVRIAAPGRVWAAAFEVPVVTAITQGCRTAGFTLRAILPAVDALGAGLDAGCAIWRDGDVHAEVMLEGGALQSVRRLPAGDDPAAEATPQPVTALHSLGEEGWRFADAYGAAVTPALAPLALRAGAYGERAVSRRRIAIAAGACAAAAVLALAAPAVSGMIDASSARRQLAAIAPRAHDAAVVEQDLRQMSAALSQVSGFAASRRPATALLAGITRALPSSAALVTLRVDSTGGTLIVLAPRAARVVAALDSVAGITASEISGPVTKEVVGTREVERATVRFRLTAEAPQ